MSLEVQAWIHLTSEQLQGHVVAGDSFDLILSEEVNVTLKKDSAIKAMKMRRFDRITQTAIYVLEKMLNEGAANLMDMDRSNVSLVVATGLGTLETSISCLDQIVDHGDKYCSPMGFMNSVHNSIAANLSQMFDLQGQNMTFAEMEAPLETALCHADMFLSEYPQQKVLVGVIEEVGPVLKKVLSDAEPLGGCRMEGVRDRCSFLLLAHSQNDGPNGVDLTPQTNGAHDSHEHAFQHLDRLMVALKEASSNDVEGSILILTEQDGTEPWRLCRVLE